MREIERSRILELHLELFDTALQLFFPKTLLSRIRTILQELSNNDVAPPANNQSLESEAVLEPSGNVTLTAKNQKARPKDEKGTPSKPSETGSIKQLKTKRMRREGYWKAVHRLKGCPRYWVQASQEQLNFLELAKEDRDAAYEARHQSNTNRGLPKYCPDDAARLEAKAKERKGREKSMEVLLKPLSLGCSPDSKSDSIWSDYFKEAFEYNAWAVLGDCIDDPTILPNFCKLRRSYGRSHFVHENYFEQDLQSSMSLPYYSTPEQKPPTPLPTGQKGQWDYRSLGDAQSWAVTDHAFQGDIIHGKAWNHRVQELHRITDANLEHINPGFRFHVRRPSKLQISQSSGGPKHYPDWWKNLERDLHWQELDDDWELSPEDTDYVISGNETLTQEEAPDDVSFGSFLPSSPLAGEIDSSEIPDLVVERPVNPTPHTARYGNFEQETNVKPLELRTSYPSSPSIFLDEDDDEEEAVKAIRKSKPFQEMVSSVHYGNHDSLSVDVHVSPSPARAAEVELHDGRTPSLTDSDTDEPSVVSYDDSEVDNAILISEEGARENCESEAAFEAYDDLEENSDEEWERIYDDDPPQKNDAIEHISDRIPVETSEESNNDPINQDILEKVSIVKESYFALLTSNEHLEEQNLVAQNQCTNLSQALQMAQEAEALSLAAKKKSEWASFELTVDVEEAKAKTKKVELQLKETQTKLGEAQETITRQAKTLEEATKSKKQGADLAICLLPAELFPLPELTLEEVVHFKPDNFQMHCRKASFSSMDSSETLSYNAQEIDGEDVLPQDGKAREMIAIMEEKMTKTKGALERAEAKLKKREFEDSMLILAISTPLPKSRVKRTLWQNRSPAPTLEGLVPKLIALHDLKGLKGSKLLKQWTSEMQEELVKKIEHQELLKKEVEDVMWYHLASVTKLPSEDEEEKASLIEPASLGVKILRSAGGFLKKLWDNRF
ncbi:hypothetical protein BT63DRAFT_411038 [Microthyrium microscopicum]|uniref:Uncharacterized protein n=1 Tax=Microthyrium microscopicum TaxID=703497 RepID=A0A6A6UHC1_9PEZI|nr:hypothetical protein BT63DRAFT_411038 [Microthyrium microscopicum]